jgi:hypothetical protein
MALEGKSEQELASLKEALLTAIRGRGGSAGNVTLQKQLAWPSDQYWAVRDLLIDAGNIQRKRRKC